MTALGNVRQRVPDRLVLDRVLDQGLVLDRALDRDQASFHRQARSHFPC